MAEYDMRRVMTFLSELIPNNNKQWFDAHKPEFKSVQSIFFDFSMELIDRMGETDEDLRGLSLKDCTYRFYRDIRFSKDKSPYKTHFGVYMCKGGKCSGRSGYYFHIEPEGAGYLYKNMLCVGAYAPQPFVVKSIREEFQFNGAEFVKNIEAAEGFDLVWDGALKTTPKGFSKDDPFADYYRLKALLLEHSLNDKLLYGKELVKRVSDIFSKTVDFNHQLNRAIDFAYEEYGGSGTGNGF